MTSLVVLCFTWCTVCNWILPIPWPKQKEWKPGPELSPGNKTLCIQHVQQIDQQNPWKSSHGEFSVVIYWGSSVFEVLCSTYWMQIHVSGCWINLCSLDKSFYLSRCIFPLNSGNFCSTRCWTGHWCSVSRWKKLDCLLWTSKTKNSF